MCLGGEAPFGKSVGASSSSERRRASVSWMRPSWGSETRARRPEGVQATWNVQSGGLAFTGVQLGVVLPGPALKEGAVHDRLGRGVRILHDWHLGVERILTRDTLVGFR